MDFKILARATKDNYSFDLFCNLLDTVNAEFDLVYLHTAKIMDFKRLAHVQFTKPNVVLGIKDVLDLGQGDPIGSEQGLQIILNCISKHKDKNFIVFTSLENLNLGPNVQVINWGGDIVNQKEEYLRLQPVLEKNFDSTKSFISLNRVPRAHRLVLLSYLFGSGVNDYGQITYIDQASQQEFLNQVYWDFDLPRQDHLRSQLIEGYRSIVGNKTLEVDNKHIYRFDGKFDANDNFRNFELRLRHKYELSFVEFVAETTFMFPAFNITEKTAHCFYACNFPIMISSVGTVKFLRSVGFDMFDDIIDHSYDTVANPYDRIEQAVSKNNLLLTDIERTKKLWIDNKHRFLYNIEVVKSIYDWFEHRTRQQFQQLNWQ